jgi:3-hydroxyisobutyrate dehydrogenase
VLFPVAAGRARPRSRRRAIASCHAARYPERAFSTRYAIKDLEYALALAAQAGIDAQGARLARERFLAAIAAGDGERYWPVIAEHIVAGGTE